MSVRNSTKLLEKFSEKDLKELDYDKKLISNYIDELSKNNINESRTSFEKRKPKLQQNLKRKLTIFSYINKNSSRKTLISSSSIAFIDSSVDCSASANSSFPYWKKRRTVFTKLLLFSLSNTSTNVSSL